MTKQNCIRSIKRVFSNTNDGNPKSPRGILFRDSPYFRGPCSTPIFPGGRMNGTMISKYEDFYKKYARKSKHHIKKPFITLFEDGAFSYNKKILLENKWRKTNLITINTWSKENILKLPDPFSLEIASFYDPRIYKEYVHLAKHAFQTKSDEVFKRNYKHITHNNLEGRIVLVRNSRGIPVGGAGVTCHNNWGWFFGGCVLPRYRKQGIWNALIAARMGATKELGCKNWLLFTENPIIQAKSNSSLKLHVFSKTSV